MSTQSRKVIFNFTVHLTQAEAGAQNNTVPSDRWHKLEWICSCTPTHTQLNVCWSTTTHHLCSWCDANFCLAWKVPSHHLHVYRSMKLSICSCPIFQTVTPLLLFQLVTPCVARETSSSQRGQGQTRFLGTDWCNSDNMLLHWDVWWKCTLTITKMSTSIYIYSIEPNRTSVTAACYS